VSDLPVNSKGLNAAAEECSFEDSLAALEHVVRDLEDGNLGLSEALDRYETGVRHLKRCYRLLEAAERRIELLTGINEDGTPATEPFVESSESLAESAGRRRRPRAKTTDKNEGSDSMT
jgi:exodeoxyribonuclease VII small subunit